MSPNDPGNRAGEKKMYQGIHCMGTKRASSIQLRRTYGLRNTIPSWNNISNHFLEELLQSVIKLKFPQFFPSD